MRPINISLMHPHKLLLFSFLFAFLACSDNGLDRNQRLLETNEIPTKILRYKEEHFPENEIVRAIEETNHGVFTYELFLEGNFELDFNEYFQIVEIEGKTKLPDSVIPTPILEYVVQHYPDNFITDWELEGHYQKVELDNGIELEFELNGDFIKMDD